MSQAPSTLSFFGPVGAAAGVSLAVFKQLEANKAIRSKAKADQIRINELIGQTQFNMLQETAILSRNARVAMGAAMTNIDVESQSAVEVIAQRFAAGVAGDTNAIQIEAERQRQAFEYQKDDIVQGASNSLGRPVVAALEGGVKGYIAGSNIASQITSGEQAAEQAATQIERTQAETDIIQANSAWFQSQISRTMNGAGFQSPGTNNFQFTDIKFLGADDYTFDL